MASYYSLLRWALFCLPPETAHSFTLRSLQALVNAGLWRKPHYNNRPINLLGLSFPNRLGVAAGLDKNGDYLSALTSLGFGFVELGTVTPKAQPGNPQPRLFRIRKAQALINRLGFNNNGIDYLIEKLQQGKRPNAIVGINIGKNATTELADAISDYQMGLQRAYPWADYITVNISSPNTRNLRDLQQGTMLTELLEALKKQQQELAETTGVYKPLLVKVAPDLSDMELQWFAEQIRYWQLDGVIATNTTITRKGVEGMRHAEEQGGLSGRPLMEPSTRTLKLLRQELGKGFPIIGVGGIMSVADAKAKLAAGADLLQVYTGLIYRGPQLVKEILKTI